MKIFLSLFLVASATSTPLLLDSSLKGLPLLVIAGGIIYALRQSSASMRHLLWTSALASLLLLPLLSLTLPEWNILPAPKSPEPTLAPSPENLVLVPSPPRVGFEELSSALATPPAPDFPVVPSENTSKTNPPLELSLKDWCFAVWALVSLFFLSRLGFNTLLTGLRNQTSGKSNKRIQETANQLANNFGIHRKVRIQFGQTKSMPMTWGILRPQLRLPLEATTWDSSQLRTVLLHELAHVKRHDVLTQFLVKLTCAIYWFNPLVWFVSRRIELEREKACDDLVLANGIQPVDYAESLLQIVSQTQPDLANPAGLAMARPTTLETRMKAILAQHLNRRRLSKKACFLVTLFGLSLALPIAMLASAQAKQGETGNKSENLVNLKEIEELLASVEKHLIKNYLIESTRINITTIDEQTVGTLTFKEPSQTKIISPVVQKYLNQRMKVLTPLGQKFVHAQDDQLLVLLVFEKPPALSSYSEMPESLARELHWKREMKSNTAIVESLYLKSYPLENTHRLIASPESKPSVEKTVPDQSPASVETLGIEDVASGFDKSEFGGRKNLVPEFPEYKKAQKRISENERRAKTLRELYTEEHPKLKKITEQIKHDEQLLKEISFKQKALEAQVPDALLQNINPLTDGAGIGVSLNTGPDGYPVIVRILPGHPAEQQLKNEDRIHSFRNSNSEVWVQLQHLKLNTIVRALRGPNGSAIHLMVSRDKDAPREVILKRKKLPSPAQIDNPGSIALSEQPVEAGKPQVVTKSLKFVEAEGIAKKLKQMKFLAAEIEFDARTNSLILKGDPQVITTLEKVATELDEPVENQEVMVRTNPLKHNDAGVMAETLRRLDFASITVIPHTNTNSLLLKGSPTAVLSLKELFPELDIPGIENKAAAKETIEERLLRVEMEMALLEWKGLGERHPETLATKAEFKTLQEHPKIRNNNYYNLLDEKIISLQADLISFKASGLSHRHPDILLVQAQLEAASKLKKKSSNNSNSSSSQPANSNEKIEQAISIRIWLKKGEPEISLGNSGPGSTTGFKFLLTEHLAALASKPRKAKIVAEPNVPFQEISSILTILKELEISQYSLSSRENLPLPTNDNPFTPINPFWDE